MIYRFVKPLLCVLTVIGSLSCGSTTKTQTPTLNIDPTAFVFPKVTPAAEGEEPVIELRTVELANTGTGRLVITNIRLSDDSSTNEFELLTVAGDNDDALDTLDNGSQFTIESGQNRKIAIRYTPGDENAADTGSVEFTTNDPENANVSIPISVREDSPELIFRPNSLDFGRIAVGESKSLEVTLTNIGGFDLDIRDLKVVGRTDFRLRVGGEDVPVEGLANSLIIAPDDSVVVTVTFSPETASKADSELHIVSNSRLNRTEIVNLRANGAVPCIRVSPEFVDFGSGLLVEDRESETPNKSLVTIESCGTSNLRIDGIRIEQGGENFDVLNLPTVDDGMPLFELPATVEGDPVFPSEQVEVGFWPDEIKAYGGRMIIESSSPQSPHFLDLIGRGVDNQCPIPIVAENQFNVPPLDVIVLDGTPSTDPDGGGAVKEYHWTVVERPDGSVSVPLESFNDERRPADGGPADDISTPRAKFFVDLAGRYTIELRVVDELGTSSCPPQAVATVQIESVPDKDLHIQLVWSTPADPDETDSSGTDVDIHLRHERAADGWGAAAGKWDCYFENKTPDWGEQGSVVDNPTLDIDDRNGAGPENINLSDPEIGVTYNVGVIYFRPNTGFGVEGMELADYPAFATVRLYAQGELLSEFVNKKLTEPYQLWDVVKVRWCEDLDDVRRCPAITTVDRLFSLGEYRSGPTDGGP